MKNINFRYFQKLKKIEKLRKKNSTVISVHEEIKLHVTKRTLLTEARFCFGPKVLSWDKMTTWVSSSQEWCLKRVLRKSFSALDDLREKKKKTCSKLDEVLQLKNCVVKNSSSPRSILSTDWMGRKGKKGLKWQSVSVCACLNTARVRVCVCERGKERESARCLFLCACVRE